MQIIKTKNDYVNTCKFIVRVIVLEGFAGCMRERKRYQTNIKHETKFHAKIDAESMVEKVMPK